MRSLGPDPQENQKTHLNCYGRKQKIGTTCQLEKEQAHLGDLPRNYFQESGIHLSSKASLIGDHVKIKKFSFFHKVRTTKYQIMIQPPIILAKSPKEKISNKDRISHGNTNTLPSHSKIIYHRDAYTITNNRFYNKVFTSTNNQPKCNQ